MLGCFRSASSKPVALANLSRVIPPSSARTCLARKATTLKGTSWRDCGKRAAHRKNLRSTAKPSRVAPLLLANRSRSPGSMVRHTGGIAKASFGFCFNFGLDPLDLGPEHQLSLTPIQLSFVETLPGVVYHDQRLSQHGKPLFDLLRFSVRLGEEGKKIWLIQLCPCRRPGTEGVRLHPECEGHRLGTRISFS